MSVLERRESVDVDEAALALADLQLTELVETMEAVDWRDVPTMSPAEAAALSARLEEARDAVRDQASPAEATGVTND